MQLTKILICALSCISIVTAQSGDPRPFFTPDRHEQVQYQANSWIESAIVPLSYEEVQIVANTVYLTYASNLLECKARRAVAVVLTSAIYLYTEVDAYAFDATRYEMLTSGITNLQELVSTREFINAAWGSCRSYIETEEFTMEHSLAIAAIEQFRAQVQVVAQEYLTACMKKHGDTMNLVNDMVEYCTRDLRAGTRDLILDADRYDVLNDVLESGRALKKSGAHALELGVSLDRLSTDLLEVVKRSSIAYYKQLYLWMIEQQIPAEFMTYLFDADGIVCPERRTELLQNPANLSYYSI